MIVFVYGGSSSGKSEYAESAAVSLSGKGNRFYAATMDSHGEEAKRRIRKHLAQREGKGFITVECPVNICDVEKSIPDIASATLLIESVPTLLANEMFGNYGSEADNDHATSSEHPPMDALAQKIGTELLQLCRKAKHAVLVSDDIFEDGMEYDDFTKHYAEVLGEIHLMLADAADMAVRVHEGIPLILKDVVGRMENEFNDLKNRFTFPAEGGFILVTGGFAQGKLTGVLEQIYYRCMQENGGPDEDIPVPDGLPGCEEDAVGLKDITADLRDNAYDLKDITADLKDIAADLKVFSADLKNSSADLKNVSADLKDITADLKDVATDLKDITADLKDVTTDLKDVTADMKKIGTGLKDIVLIIDEYSFDTIDLYADPADALREGSYRYLVINHLHKIIQKTGFTKDISGWIEDLKYYCKKKGVTLIIISDEVGRGVVPADMDSIRFRENTGEALRSAASAADLVYTVSCGIPLRIK